MGLPGSGKTTLAKLIAKKLNADWLNADVVRGKYNDWDFSKKGILRQVNRMRLLAKKSKNKFVVADFVCPLKLQYKIFKPNYVVWMDTIKKSRYSNMNKIFNKPNFYDLRVTTRDADLWSLAILDNLLDYNWKNKAETGQMLGRFQPFHEGHQKLFYEIIKKNNQVYIMVKDVHNLGDNPFNFLKIKKKIKEDLKPFSKRFKIILVPNITKIYYGRKVGYKFEQIHLPKNIQKISATKIRKHLRLKKKLKEFKIN